MGWILLMLNYQSELSHSGLGLKSEELTERSMAGSTFQTPATVRQTLSARPTPAGNRSVSAGRRSKVAGALRGGTDIDGDGELSDILEDEQEMQRVSRPQL